MSSLVRISSKLFPLKREIETSWMKNINSENFASWNILNTYAFYCRIILKDLTKACIFEDYCKIIAHRLKNKQELSYSSPRSMQ